MIHMCMNILQKMIIRKVCQSNTRWLIATMVQRVGDIGKGVSTTKQKFRGKRAKKAMWVHCEGKEELVKTI
jgi:hypothetical protein